MQQVRYASYRIFAGDKEKMLLKENKMWSCSFSLSKNPWDFHKEVKWHSMPKINTNSLKYNKIQNGKTVLVEC